MTHQASSALGHALCAMHKAFNLKPAVADNATDLVKSAFAGEYNARRTLLLEKLHRRGVRYAHLGGDVKRYTMPLAHRDNAPVSHDECIHVRLRCRDECIDLTGLVLEDDRIEG